MTINNTSLSNIQDCCSKDIIKIPDDFTGQIDVFDKTKNRTFSYVFENDELQIMNIVKNKVP